VGKIVFTVGKAVKVGGAGVAGAEVLVGGGGVVGCAAGAAAGAAAGLAVTGAHALKAMILIKMSATNREWAACFM
jgi:hypothetical protein